MSIELLAPAKNLEAGKAAITCGADAVYIGATQFGAREAAGNSLADIAALAEYAHRYWVRVYVTLNTLLYDDEFPAAVQLIHDLHAIGIDGLIIQDVGLLECDLPPIPLIASTQMHNAAPEKIRFLEQIGIQRVILARELSLEQIRAIRAATTTIQLECFVHGAICVSYSGQCYLSYAIGGRSGNRGQCAQPCRRPYTLLDAHGETLVQDRYLLSLKDMDRSAFLPDLLDAGVTAFKIEGRLKDTAYVMNIVSYYRQQLDQLLPKRDLQKASSGVSSIDFTPDPHKTFNRGYTPYFLTGRDRDMASLRTPKALGESIGTVRAVRAGAFTISTDIPLHNGDGICFLDRNEILQGTIINNVQGESITPDSLTGITPGTMIYRNYDHTFTGQLKASRMNRRIAVRFHLSETPEGFMVNVVDEDGNEAEYRLTAEKTPARKPDAALRCVMTQFSKCGNSDFVCADVQVTWQTPYFLTVAALNTLRREVLSQLAAVRAQHRPVATGTILKNAVPYPEHELTYQGNVLNQYADAFYRRHGVQQIEPAAESGLDMQGRQVMRTRYCLKYQLGYCLHEQDKQPVAEPGLVSVAEPLFLVDDQEQRCTLRFNCDACEMEVWWGRSDSAADL
jgi:23S rRNA 5-hydroxycytidine C2501 synthase